MKFSSFISFAVTIMFSLLVKRETAFAQTSLFASGKFTNGKGDTLQYRYLSPDYDTSRKYPLVIFLHGSGERGTDNEAQLKWGAASFAKPENMILHPAVVIAPQCPPGMLWSNISEDRKTLSIKMESSPSKTMELLMGLIKKTIKDFHIDTNRIYITGLSMGGYGTFDAIERYPDFFAAAVPVCGAGDLSKAATIAHIPIWIFHGADDPAVPAAYSTLMATALMKAGARPGLTIYPGVGHFSWLPAYNDAAMMEWMFLQKKN